VIAVAGTVAAQLGWVSGSVVGVVLGAWVVKDLALYPLLRPHMFADRGPATRDLVGRPAVVSKALSPEGYVKLGNERWRARTAAEGRLEEGVRVRVVDADGMILTVEPESDGSESSDPLTGP